MARIRYRKALAGCAGLAAFALLFTLVMAGPAHARHRITRTLTFEMPPCPIEAKTVLPTKTEFRLPRWNPLGEPVSVAGSVQVTDQTGSTVLLITPALAADQTGVTFSRTVKTIQHATGELSFDKGCTTTDPYGSNDCTWTWRQSVTSDFQGTLQEDITSGKLIVDLSINNTIPFQFTCSICGASCPVTIPEEIDHGAWNRIWDLVISLIRNHSHRPPPFP